MASSLRALRTAARSFSLSSPRNFSTRVAASARIVAPRALVFRNFSSSQTVFGSGETDLALSQKLAEELQFEKESTAQGEDVLVPAFLQAFKNAGTWTIEDKPGHDEVALTRDFGNEHIRLLFSIADIDAAQEESEFDSQDEESQEDQPNTDAPYPIRVSISVTKVCTGKGALSIDAVAQDGAFVVDNISFYRDAKLATDVTADADWKRRGLYIGPQFDHLDVAVQELFEQYLEERGVNSALALFIPEYAEMKEQKEYLAWLQTVKEFVDV
ncbi:hypothetical protein BS47DRAFT_1298674 [Hydnum rufescens UP504]|uniref:Mitochondrial glyco protein n=1 Tax=Hydnum rufescens UP504 TaxID=1448309 RepID=A0A9P6ATH6_9AGAM|nr:hypothetical protein BS47DRAFT_1298674 [Hydnum rufescens UP504]